METNVFWVKLIMVSDKQCSLCRFRYWVCITSIIRVITFSNIITVFARFTFSFWYFSLWYILLLDKGFNTKLYSKVNFFNTCDNTFKYYLSLCFFCIALKSKESMSFWGSTSSSQSWHFAFASSLIALDLGFWICLSLLWANTVR